MIGLVLVAVSLGASNLAASVGIGVGGVDRGTRLRVALIFGLLEAGMPILGLLIGHGLAQSIGRDTKWLAAVLLMAVGCYGILRAASNGGMAVGSRGAGRGSLRLLLSGLALSVDNLVAGFALGSYQVSIAAGAVVFGLVSAAMSVAGLELGARIGRRAGERGELVGGVILIGVGAAIGLGVLG